MISMAALSTNSISRKLVFEYLCYEHTIIHVNKQHIIKVTTLHIVQNFPTFFSPLSVTTKRTSIS